MTRLILFLSFLLLSADGWSQSGLASLYMRGEITDGATGAALDAVSVTNTTRNIHVYSDADGRYSILATSGDKIAFNHMGYAPLVTEAATASDRNVVMYRKTQFLPEAIVRPRWTPYQADSIRRARTYARPLAREKSGSAMSPVTLLAEKLSKRHKQLMRFQKDFAYFEGERFIESRYTPELVATLTGMTGDSVAHFINANPMPVEYARAVGDLELKSWIRSTYRAWIARPKETTVPGTDSSSQVAGP
jgi:hypothetical protein